MILFNNYIDSINQLNKCKIKIIFLLKKNHVKQKLNCAVFLTICLVMHQPLSNCYNAKKKHCSELNNVLDYNKYLLILQNVEIKKKNICI